MPIYVYASDEEPSEDESDVSHEPEHPPIVHRATSDDSTIDTPPSPPTLPATQPIGASAAGQTQRLFAESSRGPWMRRTPRMCVRDFPIGPLAPRDKAPMTEREIPCEEPPPKRLRPAHLDWMPPILRRWRSLEGIPSTYETGESSHTPSPVHLTGEPLELTVPTLVAVIRTIFGLHYGTRGYIRELQSDTSRLDGDVASIYGRLCAVETHMVIDRESIDATRARVAMLERRERVVGVAAGISVMMTIVRMVVGMYLYYFR